VSEEINDVIVEEVDLDEAAEAVEPEAEVVAETAAETAAEAEDEASEEADVDEDVDADGAPRSKKESVLETEGEIAADYLEELLDIADLDGDIDTFIEDATGGLGFEEAEAQLVALTQRAYRFFRWMVPAPALKRFRPGSSLS
jgi:spoIIIJ-associated protein